jgi:extracellular factor (EF) 3-hydroxypalmitic acid methyl ester biosynthesis protein
VEEKGPRTKIFSVACGPAFELIKYIQGNDKKYWQDLQITLLDQDVLALKEAQRNILSAAKLAGGHVNVKLMNTNIKDLILRGTEESDFDLIYSSGLFDYFTDPVAKRAGAMLFDKLAPRGLLIIGNFSSSSPNYFGMQVVFDWHLVLRSEQDLLRLFAFENAEVKVEAEAENVNLFCNVRRAN